jgi:AraC family transcriptional activator of pyochelin receptor
MPGAASPIDFSCLLDAKLMQRLVPPGSSPTEGIYGGSDGLQIRTGGERAQLAQEVVQIADGALLFASDFSPPQSDSCHQQLVAGSDWVHIQFRLNGAGQERICATSVIDTPARSCTVIRYPEKSVVERRSSGSDSFRVACLLLSPRALTHLLDAPASRLPERTLWIACEEPLELRATVLPLSSTMRIAVSDILACPYKGVVRRGFMRAKSLELLSSVVHALDGAGKQTGAAAITLSPLDRDKIDQARKIMVRELENSLTLSMLARRVGLNRTKLALGFKQVHGVSVQAYWRDERLSRARELLQKGEARVTDVALSLGYSELSSFSRAFSRKFGVLPKTLRSPRK